MSETYGSFRPFRILFLGILAFIGLMLAAWGIHAFFAWIGHANWTIQHISDDEFKFYVLIGLFIICSKSTSVTCKCDCDKRRG